MNNEQWLKDAYDNDRKFIDRNPNFKIKRTFKQWFKDTFFPVRLDNFKKAKDYAPTHYELLQIQLAKEKKKYNEQHSKII